MMSCTKNMQMRRFSCLANSMSSSMGLSVPASQSHQSLSCIGHLSALSQWRPASPSTAVTTFASARMPWQPHNLVGRSLSTSVPLRRSPCDVHGRSSKTGRIRPAVGDQAGSRSTKDEDTEKLRIQQFIANLPSSQRGGDRAEKEVKWKGEGEAAKTFELPCASGISRLSVRCSSEDVRQDITRFMQFVFGTDCQNGDHFCLNDIEIQLDTIDQEWVKRIRKM
eukprot:632160-Hanusia_phi.AAC.1